jgi:hypothetical protein
VPLHLLGMNSAVVVNGQLFDKKDLDRFLAQVESAANNQ